MITGSKVIIREKSSVDAWNDYAWETDPNGLLTVCDEGIIKVLGFKPEQAIGNPLISFQLLAKEQSKIRAAMQNDQFPIELELNALTADKTKQMIRYTIYHKLDEEGQIQGFRGYCELLEAEKKQATKKLPKKQHKHQHFLNKTNNLTKRTQKTYPSL